MSVNNEILISKYLSGNATPGEIKMLKDWLKQSPANQERFDRLEKLWKASLHLKKENDHDVDAAWNEFRLLTEAQPEIRIRKINYGWLKVAAAVALFIVTTVVIKVFFTETVQVVPAMVEKTPVKPSPEQAVVVTPDESPVVQDTLSNGTEPVKNGAKRSKKNQLPLNGGVAMITVNAGDSARIFMLPDNSIVYLNAKSKLEYPQNFNKTNRRVSLIGEAYFDVKKDSGQFVVACENTIIRGKGTMFNVKSHAADKDVEVIVASGTVEFSGIGYRDFKKLVLNSGESGYYNKAKSVITKSKHQRKNYKWWQKKSLRAKIRDFFDKLMGNKKH